MKICIQSQDIIDEYGIEEGYRRISEAGFEAIDWNIDHAWIYSELKASKTLENLCIFEKSMDEILKYYEAELGEIRKYGLSISQCHSPFPAFVAGRPECFDYAIDIYKQLIKFAGVVDCPRVIIHGVHPNGTCTDMTPAECKELNKKLYESLIPTLKEVGSVTVCLENLPVWDSFNTRTALFGGHCSNPYLAKEEIDALNELAGGTYFGLCLDTGHLHICRTEPFNYLPVIGSRLVALHIHDNDQFNDHHLMPYTGSIRWDMLLRELKSIGYSGDISFETFAQVKKNRLPKELLPTFLRTIYDIGAYFKSQLEA